jgi:hypothetical protein
LITAVMSQPVEPGEHDFTQTWSWDEAEHSAARAVARVTVAQVMGHLHPAADRINAMQTVVGALVAAGQCVATYWPGAQKWVPPDQAAGDEGFVNVRLFNVDGSGEMFMDSLGLHALGLPDLEHRFPEGDPREVASTLYSLAEYLIDNGDVIADGHTIGGDASSARWRCRRATSSVDPDRPVLVLEPAS